MTVSTIPKPRKKRKWSSTLKNYWLDMTLFIAFIIMMNNRFTGLPVHEWLGLSMGIALTYHIILHWKWIVAIGQRLSKKLSATQRVKAAVDLILFIDMVVIIITGIWISQVAMEQLGVSTQRSFFFRRLHHLASDLCIILLGLHLALSWKWIVNSTKKYVLKSLKRN